MVYDFVPNLAYQCLAMGADSRVLEAQKVVETKVRFLSVLAEVEVCKCRHGYFLVCDALHDSRRMTALVPDRWC